MSTMSLLEAIGRIAVDEANLRLSIDASLAQSAAHLGDTAKDMLGEYQPGWPALQPETIARKATGDSPLLETGELRDSIKWNSDAHEAYVGTDNPKGVYHELGTVTIPARPFLGAAVVASEKEIHKIFERNVARAFAGGGELMELLRGLREIGHEAKELGKEFFEDDEEKNSRR